MPNSCRTAETACADASTKLRNSFRIYGKGNCFSLLSIRPAIVNHPVNHLSEDESGIYPLSKNHSPFKISDISGKKFDLETLSLFSNDSSFISSTSSFSSHSNFILFLVGFFSIPSPLYLKFLPFPLDFYPLPE